MNHPIKWYDSSGGDEQAHKRCQKYKKYTITPEISWNEKSLNIFFYKCNQYDTSKLAVSND